MGVVENNNVYYYDRDITGEIRGLFDTIDLISNLKRVCKNVASFFLNTITLVLVELTQLSSYCLVFVCVI